MKTLKEALKYFQKSAAASSPELTESFYRKGYRLAQEALGKEKDFFSIFSSTNPTYLRDKVTRNRMIVINELLEEIEKARNTISELISAYTESESTDELISSSSLTTKEMKDLAEKLSENSLENNHEIVEKAWFFVIDTAHECWINLTGREYPKQIDSSFLMEIFDQSKEQHLTPPNIYLLKNPADLASWREGFRFSIANSYRMIRNPLEHSKPSLSVSYAFQLISIADFYYGVLLELLFTDLRNEKQ